MKVEKYLLFDPTSSEEGDQRIAIIVDQDIPKLTETVQIALREHYDEEVTVTRLSTDTRGYGKHHAYLVEAEMPMWDGWDKRGVFILTSICESDGFRETRGANRAV